MITFRIDDVGASTKYYNQHGKKLFTYRGIPYFYFPLANFWFFKRIPPFKQWGKYEELTKDEWINLLNIFKKYNIKPIIGITACWVNKKSKLIPFPKKFPEQAEVLKRAFINNDISIANHGLTHCVVGNHLPKPLSSNKKYHREFWPWLDKEIHKEHILKSQKILEHFFQKPITIFIPPGNVWSFKTYEALKKTNIKQVICNRYMLDSNQSLEDIEFIDDSEGFFNLHDRELKLYGKKWLSNKIKFYNSYVDKNI